VPDGDVFTRSVQPRWRHFAKALRDELPVDECQRRLEDALAKQLRVTGGLESASMRALMSEIGGTSDEQRVVLALQEIARRSAFERVIPLLIGRGRYATFDDAQAFVGMCLDGARLDVLARSLVRRPDGIGLRRPSRPRTSTAILLSESAPLGHQA
jgi:hypothetical protein